jgi:hypothetical protein
MHVQCEKAARRCVKGDTEHMGSRGVVILKLEQAAFRFSLFEQGEYRKLPWILSPLVCPRYKFSIHFRAAHCLELWLLGSIPNLRTRVDTVELTRISVCV